MLYRIEVLEAKSGFIGSVPDLGMETSTMPSEKAAVEAIGKCLSGFVELEYRRKHKPIPLPSPVGKDDKVAYVPLRLQLRIALWNSMLGTGTTQTELAAKLGISKAAVNQYVNGSANIGPEAYERALAAIGLYPDVRLHGQADHGLQLESGKKGD